MRRWSDFDKFEPIIDKYMPVRGEGETLASQTATAVCKLVYKWYNDGDVYDNSYNLKGWCNDLTTYANWLVKYSKADMLYKIAKAKDDSDYEDILWELAEYLLDEDWLDEQNQYEKIDSIYRADGPFKFEEYYEEEWEEEEW